MFEKSILDKAGEKDSICDEEDEFIIIPVIEERWSIIWNQDEIRINIDDWEELEHNFINDQILCPTFLAVCTLYNVRDYSVF